MTTASPLRVGLLVRNAGWLAVGELLNRIIGFGVALYLARVLGRSGYGTIGVAISLVNFALIFVRGGTGPIGIREVAHSPAAVPAAFARITGLRLVLALVTASVLLGVAPLLAPAVGVPTWLLILYALTLFPKVLTTVWAYRGLERMHVVAVSHAVEKLVVLVGLVAFVHSADGGLFAVPVIETAAAAVVTLWLYRGLRESYGRLPMRLEPSAWPPLLREGALVSASMVLRTVYTDGDVLLLGWLATAAGAGEFLVSHKLVLTVTLIAEILQQSAFPATSRLVRGDPGQALRLQGAILRIALLVVIPIVVAGNLFASEVLSILFGPGYAGGAPVLQILLLTLPIVAVAESMRRLLLASASAGLLVAGFAVTATVHVVLALGWIPQWGATGAAAACLLGEAVGTVTLAWIVRRLLGGLGWDWRMLVAPAAGLVAAVVAFAAQSLGVASWQATLLGAVVYGLVAVRAGAVSRAELDAIAGQLGRAGRWRVEMPD